MMTNTEIGMLLALIQVGDNRNVDEATIGYFHDVIEDRLTYEQARQAVLRFRRERPGVYLEPGHLLELAGVVEVSEWEDRTDEALAEVARRALADLGTTPKEYRADPAVRARVDAFLDAPQIEEAADGDEDAARG